MTAEFGKKHENEEEKGMAERKGRRELNLCHMGRTLHLLAMGIHRKRTIKAH